MAVFPPQELDCPDPQRCPIISSLPELRTVMLDAGRPLFRVYNPTWGYDEHNIGFGDARFSPFDDLATGNRVPALYLAEEQVSALLETVFHDVDPGAASTGYEKDLVGQVLAHLQVPAPCVLGDLRNPELARLAIRRDRLVATPSEHYPCTRRLARDALSRQHSGKTIAGLIWHSRQAELSGRQDAEVMVVFGHRDNHERGSWDLIPLGVRNLFEGPGRSRIDEIAESLGATVEPLL